MSSCGSCDRRAQHRTTSSGRTCFCTFWDLKWICFGAALAAHSYPRARHSVPWTPGRRQGVPRASAERGKLSGKEQAVTRLGFWALSLSLQLLPAATVAWRQTACQPCRGPTGGQCGVHCAGAVRRLSALGGRRAGEQARWDHVPRHVPGPGAELTPGIAPRRSGQVHAEHRSPALSGRGKYVN